MAVCLVLMVLLLLQSFALSSSQCHIHRDLSTCSNQNLRRVPVPLSHHITKLDISHNRLETILLHDFVSYSALRSLIMSHNQIRLIPDRAFIPLIHLEKLDLSMNQLAELSSGWFQTLSSLRDLNLLGNKYKTLGESYLFQHLENLESLQIGGPFLQTVRRTDFFGLKSVQKLVFDGKNLQSYAKGSMRHLGPVGHVTLGLNSSLARNSALVQDVLSDVVRPNSTLTFTDSLFYFTDQVLPLKVAYMAGTKTISFKNVTISFASCMALLSWLPWSNISTFRMEDAKFLLQPMGDISTVPNDSPVETVFFKNVFIPQFYNIPALFFLQPLLSGLRSVSVINGNFYALPCNSAADFAKLEYMDASENFLSDEAIGDMLCNGKGVLLNLQTLNVSRNNLRTPNSGLFTQLLRLKHIDMSGNVFHNLPETCDWPPGLRFLNLSSTQLTKATTCLPESLHVLDLSHNELTVFNVTLPLLTHLYISGNRINMLPDGSLYPGLVFISIKYNNLQTFSSSNLSAFQSLKTLEAAASTFVCSCDFVAFMAGDLTKHQVQIGDDLATYVCDSPDAKRGTSVTEVRLSVFECHIVLALSLLCLLLLVMFLLIAGLCYKFSIVWYVKMTCAWLRAKRKPKLKKGELVYDAFVSYSEMDSGWVEAHLVPELEQTEPRLQLCLHKRDFLPGGWIIDNIMDAIEKSHKTLFVLSQHFVQSEWCKYELDYSHFRLFDQNDDAVVLILLEPIDKTAIPKKFCKLRQVMNSRTYLEWPDDQDEVGRFWQSLRGAIRGHVAPMVIES